jgi:ABC-type phosphate/phosphonate transport system substrate-binding protein
MPLDACTAAARCARPVSDRKVRLPWYDFEFLREDHSRLWQNLRHRLLTRGVSSVPAALDADPHLDDILASPALLLSQTCGYDIAVACPAELQPVLTPIYATPGCGHGTYSSFVVVARDSLLHQVRDLSSARFVANDDRSWSGFHCMREVGVTWASVQFSGGHQQSLQMIERDDADWAAIDSLAWGLLCDHDPGLDERFRILATTREVPAPPLVTSMQTEREVLQHLRSALRAIVDDPTLQGTLQRLRISGFVEMHRSAYQFMDLDRRRCREPAHTPIASAVLAVS